MKILISRSIIVCAALAFITTISSAQELKYRRSSLQMILLESDNFPNKDMVVKAYSNQPFPDKYNNHNVGVISFDPKKHIITDADRVAGGQKLSGKFGKLTKGAASEATNGLVDSTAKDIPLQIEKYIKETQLAKQLVGKWFNRTKDGKLNYELIKERGMYSASEEDKALANSGADGNEYLMDLELIGNTFVVFNKLKFIENEPAARLLLNMSLAKANEITVEAARNKAIETANKIYERTKEGYTVFTTSWLYQLNWNKEVADQFKATFLNEKIDAKAAWDTTQMFKLNFIGDEMSSSLVTFSLKGKRTEEQIINLAVQRNVDNVFAKLQKEYEVFRPVTPISSIGPLTAKIGMKEGLEPGQSFEILETQKDPKTGVYSYVSIGSAKIAKEALIWDNRKGSSDEPLVDAEGKPIVTPEFTPFEGGKKAQPGMHFLRLKK